MLTHIAEPAFLKPVRDHGLFLADELQLSRPVLADKIGLRNTWPDGRFNVCWP